MSGQRPTTTCPRCSFRWQRRATRREMRLRRALEWLARELANDRAASGEGAQASEAAVRAVIDQALAAAEVTPDAPDTP